MKSEREEEKDKVTSRIQDKLLLSLQFAKLWCFL